MSDTNHQPTPDILDTAIGALRDAPVPAGPSADLATATVAAVHNRLAGAVPSELARQQRRRRIMRYIGYGTATAVVVAVATAAGILWFGGGSATAHFQKALDNAERAKSVKVTMTIENGGKVTHVGTLYRQGDMIRAETVQDAELPDKPVIVGDLKTRKTLTLLPQTKTAQRATVGEQELRFITGMLSNFTDLRAQLGGKDAKAVKEVGTETIGDRKTTAYELTAKGPLPGLWKVWVDPKTNFPVRARLAQEKGKNAFTLDFEDWNKDFDPKLFSLDPPEGYKLIDAPKAPEVGP